MSIQNICECADCFVEPLLSLSTLHTWKNVCTNSVDPDEMVHMSHLRGPPGILGIWGEWLFIFRELGSTGNYVRGAREQAHNFGDLGSLAKKQKKN